MTTKSFAILPISLLILAGCNGAKPSLPPAPPHGGTAFPLPEGVGFIEALRQDAQDRPGRTQLVIYFLDAQHKPITPSPVDASFKPRTRGGSPVALKPTGDADASRTGGLASDPFDDPGEIVGEISATLDGKPVTVAISVR
jgi:hypothetical protein